MTTAALFATGTLLWLAGTFVGPPAAARGLHRDGRGSAGRHGGPVPRAARRAAGRAARCRRADRALRATRGPRRIRVRRRRAERLRAALRGANVAVGRTAARLLRGLSPHDPVLLAGRGPGLRAVAPDLDAGRRGCALLTRDCCWERRARSACCRGLTRRSSLLTLTCALRWTSLRARGNPLLWTLYAGFAWLPVAALLQLARDGAFVADRRMGAWSRTDPRTRHGFLRRHAGGDGHTRDDGAFRTALAHGSRHARLLHRAAAGRGQSRAERNRAGAGRRAVVPARERGLVGCARSAVWVHASAASTCSRASTGSRADGRVLPRAAPRAHRVRDPVGRACSPCAAA